VCQAGDQPRLYYDARLTNHQDNILRFPFNTDSRYSPHVTASISSKHWRSAFLKRHWFLLRADWFSVSRNCSEHCFDDEFAQGLLSVGSTYAVHEPSIMSFWTGLQHVTTKEAIQPSYCVPRWLKPKPMHEAVFHAFKLELGLYQSHLMRNQISCNESINRCNFTLWFIHLQLVWLQESQLLSF
jgi:hypothetical protein